MKEARGYVEGGEGGVGKPGVLFSEEGQGMVLAGGLGVERGDAGEVIHQAIKARDILQGLPQIKRGMLALGIELFFQIQYSALIRLDLLIQFLGLSPRLLLDLGFHGRRTLDMTFDFEK